MILRSQLSLIGLLLVLMGCANQDGVTVSQTPSIAPSTDQEREVSEPFQELLTETETNPPRLIPELAPSQVSSNVTTDAPGLSSVPVPATDAPLSVPVPPAPAIIQTVPIPNSNPSVRVAPGRSTPNVASAQQPSVTAQTRSPSSTGRSTATQPQTVQPQIAQGRAVPSQTVAVQRNSQPTVASNSLAESVQVTGIVHAGSMVSAIVQVPNEQSSRYVRAGDYLANGSILVSRIEITPNDEARVVFVQNGVQIVKTVGNF